MVRHSGLTSMTVHRPTGILSGSAHILNLKNGTVTENLLRI